MFAQLNHIAITSDQYAIIAKFYEALFGLRTPKNPRPARACVVSDGIVGMNIIPRREGRTSGPDHFGLQVENIKEAKERIYKFDPSTRTLKRPPVAHSLPTVLMILILIFLICLQRVYRCRKTFTQMSFRKQKGVSSISPSEPRMPSDARNFTTKFSSSA